MRSIGSCVRVRVGMGMGMGMRGSGEDRSRRRREEIKVHWSERRKWNALERKRNWLNQQRIGTRSRHGNRVRMRVRMREGMSVIGIVRIHQKTRK